MHKLKSAECGADGVLVEQDQASLRFDAGADQDSPRPKGI